MRGRAAYLRDDLRLAQFTGRAPWSFQYFHRLGHVLLHIFPNVATKATRGFAVLSKQFCRLVGGRRKHVCSDRRYENVDACVLELISWRSGDFVAMVKTLIDVASKSICHLRHCFCVSSILVACGLDALTSSEFPFVVLRRISIVDETSKTRDLMFV